MTKAARLLLCLALAVTASSTLQTWLPGGQPTRKVRMADAAPELSHPATRVCATVQPV